ncbi:MAG: copper chaperone NosL [Marinoscillum sp.]|jgi:copper chaperone NosL
MLAGALLLLTLFVVPIWNITLEAPQYPDTIGMNIHINRFADAGENDIKNINIMNHYVGMKDIPEVIPEFAIFPYVLLGMIALGVILGFVGKRQLYLVWFALMVILGSLAMYDFYSWEYEYGHELKQTAAIKFSDKDGNPMSYQPPLIGAKTILNFRAISMPRAGAYLLLIGMGLSVLAFFRSKTESIEKHKFAILLLPLMIGLFSCQVKAEPIRFGEDACSFCKMTIVDKQHAAQAVTEKGKNYKYDAIECLMNDLNKWDRPPIQLMLVADYEQPGALVPAQTAHFIITDEISSPMGAFLTAFAKATSRDTAYKKFSGTSLDWNQLRKHFNLSE